MFRHDGESKNDVELDGVEKKLVNRLEVGEGYGRGAKDAGIVGR
jgi:hypothetical protein